MSTTVVDNMQRASAEDAPGLDDLQSLLRSFVNSTEQLEATHAMLQRQVAALQRELVEARAKLQRSESLAALGQMAAGIAHEIRNPLGSIQLFVQVLADDLVDDAQSREICEKIRLAVRRMDAIVSDVLQFARDTRIRPQAVTLGRLADDALRCCESLLRTRAVEVTRAGDGELVVQGDPSLLNIALANVLRNAIEVVTDRTPRVTLTLSRRRVVCPNGHRDERAVITVDDNGPGVPEDVMKRMFNPFFTTRETGTGLGLAIVHRIVDAHGGHVTVSNIKRQNSEEISGARIELAVPVQQACCEAEACQIEVGTSLAYSMNHQSEELSP